MTWKHPKYYKELERIRKQQEQADKRASEQAKRGERASKRAIKRQGSERASNAEYDPNRWLRGKVFRGDQAEDRGSSYSRIILQA